MKSYGFLLLVRKSFLFRYNVVMNFLLICLTRAMTRCLMADSG